MVPRGEQKPRSRKAGCRTDQSLEILVGLGDCVAIKAYICRVPSNSAQMLDDRRGLCSNRLAQLDATVEAMDSPCQDIAGSHVRLSSRSYIVSDELDIKPIPPSTEGQSRGKLWWSAIVWNAL